MIPTIDISVLGVLAAVGSFLATLWRYLKIGLDWAQKKFVLFWLGSRVGRVIAEFALFGIWYSVSLRIISALIQYIIGETFVLVSPPEMVDVWRFLNLTFPIRDLLSLITDVVSLLVGWNMLQQANLVWLRIRFYLASLMHVGRP